MLGLRAAAPTCPVTNVSSQRQRPPRRQSLLHCAGQAAGCRRNGRQQELRNWARVCSLSSCAGLRTVELASRDVNNATQSKVSEVNTASSQLSGSGSWRPAAYARHGSASHLLLAGWQFQLAPPLSLQCSECMPLYHACHNEPCWCLAQLRAQAASVDPTARSLLNR